MSNAEKIKHDNKVMRILVREKDARINNLEIQNEKYRKIIKRLRRRK